ncbi:MAG: alanyl-tRNA synthetase [Rhodothermales bacterium]
MSEPLEPDSPDRPPAAGARKSTTWLKRFGAAGFLFFLVKGLLWLTLPAILLYFGC